MALEENLHEFFPKEPVPPVTRAGEYLTIYQGCVVGRFYNFVISADAFDFSIG